MDSVQTKGALIFVLVAANLFVLSLLLFWGGGYVTKFRERGFLVFGHAMLYLSVGVGFIGLGYISLFLNGCQFLIHDLYRGTISDIAKWSVETGNCSWVGIGFIIFGAFVTLPSVKLGIGLLRGNRA